jgi:hypothetical protein
VKAYVHKNEKGDCGYISSYPWPCLICVGYATERSESQRRLEACKRCGITRGELEAAIDGCSVGSVPDCLGGGAHSFPE